MTPRTDGEPGSNPGPEQPESGAVLASRTARFLTRSFLLLYPRSFRRELGDALVRDVGRRAEELSDSASPWLLSLWLVRLGLSLGGNALGAWWDGMRDRGPAARPSRRARARKLATGPSLESESPGGRATTFSWLDVKLGLRMLVKHPGLTAAGGLGIAVAIAIGAGFFAFAYSYFYPTIPLDEGHRLVSLENWDVARNNEDRRAIHDFHIWRDEMESVVDMGAFRDVSRTLITRDGGADLVQIAEITPSGFTAARVPPLMGRTLVEGDGDPDASPVLVIGYDQWRTRFGADPEILGKEVRLGGRVHTIVGVMPEGFAFPMNHDLWAPLEARPSDYELGEGPWIHVFGRLAPGYTLEEAQAELTVIGRRMAREHPETHGKFRAQIMPYIYTLVDVNQDGGKGFLLEFGLMNAMISLLLLVVCVNVAALVYARTATRRGELAVRAALGASRRRIVSQLFVESLVLSVAGAALGLGIARLGLRYGRHIMETEIGGGLPFWTDFGIPGAAYVYTGALAVLAALITGVLPGLQATGRKMHANLQLHNSGTGPRLGRTWTFLIVAQVAIAVAALPMAAATGWWEAKGGTTEPAFDRDRHLIVWVMPDPDSSPTEGEDPQERRARLTQLRTELARRVRAEPGVVDHVYMPNFSLNGSRMRVALEGDTATPGSGAMRGVRALTVGPDFFRYFELEVLSGRVFLPADGDSTATDVAVVNRAFLGQVLGGGEALGRRISLTSGSAPSSTTQPSDTLFEIVGVVENLFRNPVDESLVAPRVYRPMRGEWSGPANLTLKLADADHGAIAGRVRQIAAELDPTVRIRTLSLAALQRQEHLVLSLTALILGLVFVSVLLLSAAGIYALMSFTVTQQRREIGIRRALGAQRRALLGGIFARAAGRIAVGVALGVGVALAVDAAAEGEILRGFGPPLLSTMVLIMTVVGLLAAVGPARRGLRIEPAEVLKEE